MTTSKPPLSAIRKVFPNWPSELDTAKAGNAWASMAQNYFCAAMVLHEEAKKGHQSFNESVGKQIVESDLMRMECQNPSVWCLCFSLELAVKAVHLCTHPSSITNSKGKLTFAGHDHSESENIQLTVSEKEFLNLASKIVKDGKYPSSAFPNDSAESFSMPSFESCWPPAKAIYDKAMNFVQLNQKPPTQ